MMFCCGGRGVVSESNSAARGMHIARHNTHVCALKKTNTNKNILTGPLPPSWATPSAFTKVGTQRGACWEHTARHGVVCQALTPLPRHPVPLACLQLKTLTLALNAISGNYPPQWAAGTGFKSLRRL